MNDKTNNPQEKIGTAIDSDELRDEELQDVAGGAVYMRYNEFMPSIRRGSKGSFTKNDGTEEFWSAEFITD